MVWRIVSVALMLVLGSTVEAFVPSACVERSTRSGGILSARALAIVKPSSRRISQTELESSSLSSSSPSHLGSSRSDETSETDETSKTLSSIENDEQQQKNKEELVLQAFLTKEYSAFAKFLSLNAGIWERLDKESAVTVFVPTNAAFDKLGEKRLRQLRDVRNEEIAQKIGLYHVVVGDAVSAARLRTEDWTVKLPAKAGQQPRPIKVSGLVTMGGEVPVDRVKPQSAATAGGSTLLQRMFGGGVDAAIDSSSNNKNNNDICIGPAGRLQKTYKLDNGKYYVHEVDGFISPDILWRYCDQLRIPGF
jgi:uncharacterized surface protein with fasciclin (FAS1) repeats